MKSGLSILTLLAAAPAVAAMSAPQQGEPSVESNDILSSEAEIGDRTVNPDSCTDTIREVRDERGLPLLQRDTADPEEPILFSALDYDIDGCDVLLVGDGAVREVPRIDDDGPLVHRAR